MAEVTIQTADLDHLGRRYQALQLRLANLQGRERELLERRTNLSRDVSLAKARIALAPEAADALNFLQEKAHARSLGKFEDLLTAFVDDVIPDAGRIHLELGQSGGAPALDIQLDFGGDKESILEGNGGSLTNVVVTGLGYSALSRTNNRPLMLLDEPDCWLAQDNVPNFVRVITEVANPREEEDGSYTPGVQTLMITHNEAAKMADGADIKKLCIEKDIDAFAERFGIPVVEVPHPDDGKTECAYVVWVTSKSGKDSIEIRYRGKGEGDDERNALTKGFPFITAVEGARSWKPDEVGVRWIEGVNVRSHVRTRMYLSSGLNVLTGGNNAGKSNLVVTSLRAMAYGESDDSMIRHGADSAIVRMGLEGDVMLEMVRNRKGSPKVLFRRYINGKLVNEGRPETNGSVPDFITESLRVTRVDGLDIQLRSQKSPVFLLNEPATKRARLLSVGRESGFLQAVIEKQRLTLKRDKEAVKRDEIDLNLVNRTLAVMAPLSGMSALTEILDGLLADAKASQTNLVNLRKLVSRLAPLDGKAKIHAATGSQLDDAPVVPRVSDTRPLAALVARMSRTKDVARLPLPPEAPAIPTITDTKSLRMLGVTIKRTRDAARLPDMPDAPVVPALGERTAGVATLNGLMARLTRGAPAGAILATLPESPALPKVQDASALRRASDLLAKHTSAIAVATKEEAAIVVEHKQAEQALQALQDEIGICPTCSKPFGDHHHD